MDFRSLNQKGLSLIEVTIVSGILIVIGFSFASMIFGVQKETRAIEQKLELLSTQSLLLNYFIRSDYCNCAFRGVTINTTPPIANWSREVQALPSTFVQPFPAYPAPCTPQGSFITKDQNLPGTQIKINEIKLINFVDLGGSTYAANMQITPDANSLVRALKPIEVPLSLSIDMSAGSPNARPILGCSTSNSDLCPAGMTLIGTAGTEGSFCIDTVARGPQSYENATQTCASLSSPRGAGYICDFTKWNKACLTLNFPNQPNWISQNIPQRGFTMVYSGHGTFPSSCYHGNDSDHNNANPFRCCID